MRWCINHRRRRDGGVHWDRLKCEVLCTLNFCEGRRYSDDLRNIYMSPVYAFLNPHNACPTKAYCSKDYISDVGCPSPATTKLNYFSQWKAIDEAAHHFTWTFSRHSSVSPSPISITAVIIAIFTDAFGTLAISFHFTWINIDTNLRDLMCTTSFLRSKKVAVNHGQKRRRPRS